MTRENRINLIVTAVILALVLPGGVILFRKKSQPGERPIGSPDPVRQSTAYMDPYPSESYKRIAPIRTLQWVAGIANDGAQGDVIRITRATTAPTLATTPTDRVQLSVGEAIFYGDVAAGSTTAQVMSPGRRVQLVTRGATPSPWLRAILWEENINTAALSAQVDGSATNILSATQIPLPIEIRHELQEAGFVLPPNNITLVTIAAPANAHAITFKWAQRNETAALP